MNDVNMNGFLEKVKNQSYAQNANHLIGIGRRMIELVKVFVEVAKDLRPEYIESWLKGEVRDFDMDMVLIDEKKNRSYTYKKLAEEK